MSTERQIQASRANGAKSRGPVSAEGKRHSSRNATTHGLLAGTIVIKGESVDRFLNLVATLYKEFQPKTPFEKSLIDDMAAARWRRMRIWAMEKAGMEAEMRKQAGSCQPEAPSIDPAARAALAFRSLSDTSRSLDLINRYDSRYQREYLRAHRRFLEVRDRRAETAPAPAPTPKLAPAPQVISSERTRQTPANKRAALQPSVGIHRGYNRDYARSYERIPQRT
jgi:hypothetical protein